jgi:hypothetical protein
MTRQFVFNLLGSVRSFLEHFEPLGGLLGCLSEPAQANRKIRIGLEIGLNFCSFRWVKYLIPLSEHQIGPRFLEQATLRLACEPADHSAPQLESFGRDRWLRFIEEPGRFLGCCGDLAAHLFKGVPVEIRVERDCRMTEDFAVHLFAHSNTVVR